MGVGGGSDCKHWLCMLLGLHNKRELHRLGTKNKLRTNPRITKIYKWKPFASRPIGRPKNRWEDDVRKDLQTMKIKN
jgi:hypothetical protein